jgi:hypothetical protein
MALADDRVRARNCTATWRAIAHRCCAIAPDGRYFLTAPEFALNMQPLAVRSLRAAQVYKKPGG